ncbi:MAG: hypothetical protein K0Q99_260 [Clostridia bacterium]|jgi:hypothetical protein|nr:hypothetical protein [Clostridia bacterium]
MTHEIECVLSDRACIECGECDICDLDNSKICDNCCNCIENDADFKGIYIDDLIDSDADINIDDEDIEIKFDEAVTDKIK